MRLAVTSRRLKGEHDAGGEATSVRLRGGLSHTARGWESGMPVGKGWVCVCKACVRVWEIV